MFNREMRVKMVKSKKEETSATPESNIAKYVYITETARKLLKDSAKVIALYITLDTVRQVAVEIAKRP